MDYLDFGDNIDHNKYNALVYLLRKFKKLTSNLTLGAYRLESDYGTFNFSDGFVNVGNNWILENPVTVTSNDVLKNTFYTFNFVVIDVNTTGTVNRRIVSVTEGTGETGTLELTIPSNLIGTDEVILPNFTLEVVFDEHEYYTQLPDVHLSLSVDKRIIEAGEVATITGLLTDSTSTPIENVRLPLNVDGTTVTVITDSTGEFNYAYTGTGTVGKLLVSSMGVEVFFYDGTSDYVTAVVTGNSISLGTHYGNIWLVSSGSVVVDWGDGTSDTINKPREKLSHTYDDGLNEHLIIFDGTVTSLGNRCFWDCYGLTSIVIPDSVTSFGDWCFHNCYGLTSIVIPDSVTSLGISCFNECSGLTSIVIPDSVTSLGKGCFYKCTSLVAYELYWETQPIQYDPTNMPVNNSTVFTIPYGTTSVYTDAGYPVANLVERGTGNYNLVLSSTTPIIQKEGTAIVNAVLTRDNVVVSGETLNYVVKHGDSVLDSGTITTGSDGTASISYTGTGVGDIEVIVSYGTLLQETYELQDFVFYDPSSQANVSKYTPSSGLSLTFEDDHYTTVLYYDNWKTIRFANNLNLTDFEIEYDVKFDGTKISSQFVTANVQSGFQLNNSFFFNFSPIDKSPFDVKYDTWYHVKATKSNGTFTVKVFENDIEAYSLSQSNATTLQFLDYRVGWERSAKTYLKNIKLKAL